MIPKEIYHSVYDLNPAVLRQQGIRVLMADLDNTLVRYRVPEADEALRTWNSALKQEGVQLFLVSNSRKPDRPKRFAKSLGIPYIGHAGKPHRRSFLAVMEQTNTESSMCAMVGDQIFTDILGANRAGVRSILVHPLARDTLFRTLRYGVETPFRLICKLRGGDHT